MCIRFILLLFVSTLLVACGGGGGGSSSSPPPPPPPPSPGSVTDDSITLVEDNPTTIDVLDNDSNVTAASLAIESDPANGSATVSSGRILYTPAADYVGADSFTYSVEGEDGVSLSASVSITVMPVTVTSMEVDVLSIPTTGYVSGNDAELGANVLTSPVQEWVVPPNVISVLLSLSGPAANIDGGGLFISSLVPPSGPFAAFQRFVNICVGGLCSSLVPRSPAVAAESGLWTFTLGTLAGDLNNIDFSGLTLTATIRTGPEPDTSAERPALIRLKPFVTADSVTSAQVDSVLMRIEQIAADNQVELVIEPVTMIDDAQFNEVSSSFLDAQTALLVSMGSADAVNLFFIEGFSDTDSLGGIAGGIPGNLGTSQGHNGVLVDATAYLGVPNEIFVQNTAETAFHESGHLLGLYHTTEARFSFVDVIDDTPFCEEAVHDTNNDGVANSTECPDAANPMFWFNSALVDWGPLTDGQKHVLFYSPIAVPGS